MIATTPFIGPPACQATQGPLPEIRTQFGGRWDDKRASELPQCDLPCRERTYRQILVLRHAAPTMDDIKKKVYLDIFASPGTLLPMAGGLTALMASWAMGGDAAVAFAGIAGVLAGLGVTATRLILGLDRITQDAYDQVVEKQRREQEESLERLHARLVKDQDPRTQNCLQELRHLYSRLKDKAGEDKINSATYEVIERVDQVFGTAVQQLEYSVDLWEIGRTMRGSAREDILQQREDLVRDICVTVDHLGRTVDRFHAMTTRKNRSDLARLRKELDESIRVAREVDRRTEQLTETRSYDPQEFE